MKCLICNKNFKYVTNSHLKRHRLTCKQYKEKFPKINFSWGNAISGQGKPAWNSGLTKYEDCRIKGGRKRSRIDSFCEICSKENNHNKRFCSNACKGRALSNGLIKNKGLFYKGIKSSRKGKFLDEIYGDRSEKIRNKYSISHIGCTNISRKNIIPIYGKIGFRKDVNRFFRSTWEANFARILNYLEIKWEYESSRCRFNLKELGILILDFYLPEKDLYIEVKGKLQSDARDKLVRFDILYPNVTLKILGSQEYKYFRRKYCRIVKNWE